MALTEKEQKEALQKFRDAFNEGVANYDGMNAAGNTMENVIKDTTNVLKDMNQDARSYVLAQPFPDGNTALHIAAINGNTDLAKLLVKNGASLEAKDGKNRTPIQAAKEANASALGAVLGYANTAEVQRYLLDDAKRDAELAADAEKAKTGAVSSIGGAAAAISTISDPVVDQAEIIPDKKTASVIVSVDELPTSYLVYAVEEKLGSQVREANQTNIDVVELRRVALEGFKKLNIELPTQEQLNAFDDTDVFKPRLLNIENAEDRYYNKSIELENIPTAILAMKVKEEKPDLLDESYIKDMETIISKKNTKGIELLAGDLRSELKTSGIEITQADVDRYQAELNSEAYKGSYLDKFNAMEQAAKGISNSEISPPKTTRQNFSEAIRGYASTAYQRGYDFGIDRRAEERTQIETRFLDAISNHNEEAILTIFKQNEIHLFNDGPLAVMRGVIEEGPLMKQAIAALPDTEDGIKTKQFLKKLAFKQAIESGFADINTVQKYTQDMRDLGVAEPLLEKLPDAAGRDPVHHAAIVAPDLMAEMLKRYDEEYKDNPTALPKISVREVDDLGNTALMSLVLDANDPTNARRDQEVALLTASHILKEGALEGESRVNNEGKTLEDLAKEGKNHELGQLVSFKIQERQVAKTEGSIKEPPEITRIIAKISKAEVKQLDRKEREANRKAWGQWAQSKAVEVGQNVAIGGLTVLAGTVAFIGGVATSPIWGSIMAYKAAKPMMNNLADKFSKKTSILGENVKWAQARFNLMRENIAEDWDKSNARKDENQQTKKNSKEFDKLVTGLKVDNAQMNNLFTIIDKELSTPERREALKENIALFAAQEKALVELNDKLRKSGPMTEEQMRTYTNDLGSRMDAMNKANNKIFEVIESEVDSKGEPRLKKQMEALENLGDRINKKLDTLVLISERINQVTTTRDVDDRNTEAARKIKADLLWGKSKETADQYRDASSLRKAGAATLDELVDLEGGVASRVEGAKVGELDQKALAKKVENMSGKINELQNRVTEHNDKAKEARFQAMGSRDSKSTDQARQDAIDRIPLRPLTPEQAKLGGSLADLIKDDALKELKKLAKDKDGKMLKGSKDDISIRDGKYGQYDVKDGVKAPSQPASTKFTKAKDGNGWSKV